MSKKLLITYVITIILAFMIYSLHEKNRIKYTWNSNQVHDVTNKMITVTTYNIQYGKGIDNRVDLDRTIETLRALDSDIISLQEIERYSVRSKFRDQVKIIAKELEMNAVFYPSISYPGIYYGNAILSRFPIKSTEMIPFINKKENRTAILSKLDLLDGQFIYVMNTHLGLDQEERIVAIGLIYERLKEIDEPILLMGDLNSLPKKQEYQIWNSLLTKSNLGTPLQTYYSQDWQIDYIFHSREFIVNETSVAKSEASDHYPVSAVLSLQNDPLIYSTGFSQGLLLD
ncbi:endonuclease/exonuclease/phosphatase family protein [Alkalihalobacterium elongatum]|uniref:endonuclease/exonuclease/phosphatase family protein n=1 Tax=Alkalihalobacterium elongatum TaxID=2675466 RepID=UPI001C1FE2B1|nr:endonuclease/exonuclease/phosphatase family protein [Alkalihalobacterium elongatum]